jgi:hypothetical protein
MLFKFNKEKNICTIKLDGLLTIEQIFHTFDAVVSHINYKSGMSRMWDFREADLSLITPENIIAMSQYSQKYPKGINDVKVAFVVKRDLELNLTNMFKSFASNSNTPIQNFKSIEEAEEWLS